jgi:hypothetical protein
MESRKVVPISGDAEEPEVVAKDFTRCGADLNYQGRLVCGGYFDVIAETRDPYDDELKLLMSWISTRGRQKYYKMPLSWRESSVHHIVPKLVDSDLKIYDRNLLVAFIKTKIPTRRIISVPKRGWFDDLYVTHHATYGTTRDGEEWVLDPSVDDPFVLKGSLESWQKNILDNAVGNSRLLFAIFAALLGLVQSKRNRTSIGFHLHAPSSKGKTTTALVAASVTGSPYNSWRTTANGIEDLAVVSNHSFLMADDMKHAETQPGLISEVTMMLGNGQRKGRKNQKRDTFCNVWMSTGEFTYDQHLSNAGLKSTLGQQVRCIDINADAGKGLGVFDTVHEFEDAEHFANHLKAATELDSGVFADWFLRQFVPSLDKNLQRMDELHSQGDVIFVQRFNLQNASGAIARILHYFSEIYAIGELALELGVDLPDGEVERTVSTCFEACSLYQNYKARIDIQQATTSLASDVELVLARAEAIKPRLRCRNSPIPIENEAGYYDGHYDRLYIVSPVFRLELCAGMDHKIIGDELRMLGRLECDADGQQKTTRIAGRSKTLSCYKLLMPRNGNTNTQNDTRSIVKPYFKRNDVTLFHGPAQIVLPELQISVDGIYTDPPWGIDKADWDKNVWPVLSVVSAECARLLSVDGYLFWFYAEENLEHSLDLFKSFNLVRGTTYQYQSSNNMQHGTNMHTKTTKALVYSFTNKFLAMKDLKDYPIPGYKLTDEDHPTARPQSYRN